MKSTKSYTSITKTLKLYDTLLYYIYKQYNIQFWSEYFTISPAVIRNIVNYIAYPVIDEKTKKVKDMLRFIDTEMQAKMRMLQEDIDRSTYLGLLENDYQKRMVEEYGDEIGLFGRVGPTLGITDAS